jgi:predicted lipoprotein with Yx(FWY)xxD motif
MKTPSVGAIAVMGATTLLAAGCGSSKKASTSAASGATSSAQASTSAQTSAPSTTPASTPASTSGTGVTVKHAGKLGTILAAGSKRMTVYLFEADKGTTSACSGACAAAWPPVTTSGAPTALHGAMASDLGTTKRSDGTMQVTYKGHPLYYFVKDKDSGDAYGEGVKAFGAPWYVLTPKGAKVDNS